MPQGAGGVGPARPVGSPGLPLPGVPRVRRIGIPMTLQQTDIDFFRWAIYFVFGVPFLAWLLFTRSNALRVLAVLAVLVFVQDTFAARRYIWAIGIGPSNIVAYVAVVACLIRGGAPPGAGFAFAAWAAFLFNALLGLLIGSFGTPYLIPNVLAFQGFYLEGFLWFLLGLAALQALPDFRLFLIGVVGVTGVAAAAHLYCLVTGYRFPNYPIDMMLKSSGLEYGGFFTNTNSMAYAVAPVIPLALMLALHRGEARWVRVVSTSSLVLFLPSLLLTGCRGAFVVAALLSLLAIGLSRSGFGRLVIAVGGLLLVGLGVAATALLFPALFQNVLETLQTQGLETPRPLVWAGYLRLILDRPLGVGLDELNVEPLVGPYQLYVSLAHNIYLDLAARVGVLGVLSFMVLSGFIVLRLYQNLRRAAAPEQKLVLWGFLFLVTGFLIGGFFEPIYQNSRKLVQMYWLYCGAGLALCIRLSVRSADTVREPSPGRVQPEDLSWEPAPAARAFHER